MSSSTNTAVVGGIAAMDVARQTHAQNQTKVSVQHLDDAAAAAHTCSPSQDTSVTLVATPKTMPWSAIIVLLTLGVVGLVVVLVYSIVKPGPSSSP